jgi:hypothetical protein
MIPFKPVALSLAIVTGLALSPASAQMLPNPDFFGPMFETETPPSADPLPVTRFGHDVAATCSQLERAAHVAPEECGTLSLPKLVQILNAQD